MIDFYNDFRESQTVKLNFPLYFAIRQFLQGNKDF